MQPEPVYVVIRGPGHDGTRLALKEGITSFGRLPSNDVILLGDLVSRHHARILYFDGKASVQDLGSHNGCWLNGERTTTSPLGDGDVIRIGNFKITFRVGLHEESAFFADEATRDHESGVSSGSLVDTARMPAAPSESEAASLAQTIGPSEPLPEHVEARTAGESELEREISQAESDPDRGGLFLVYNVSNLLTTSSNVSAFMKRLLDFMLSKLAMENAIFYRMIPGEPEPVRVAFRNHDGSTSPPPISMTVVRWAISKGQTVFSRDITKDERFSQGDSVSMLNQEARSLVCTPVRTGDRTLGALYFSRNLDVPFRESEVDIIEVISSLAAAGIERIEFRERAMEEGLARSALARFHSPDVVERIMGDAKNPQLGLERRTATVCFSDVRGFTSFAETASIDEVSDFLNTYVEDVSSVVFSHRGTINKLLGDGIVSVFGAPYSYGNDAARAVEAALEIRTAFEELILDRPHLAALRLRMGIHTGPVLTGAVGSTRRMDYTVIGDTVNTAARIQAAATPGSVLVSQSTLKSVANLFVAKKVGTTSGSRGKEPLEVYEVVGRRDLNEYETAS